MYVYHYTVEPRLESIFRDGILKTTDVRIDPGEKPVVWFTKSPVWDATANKTWVDKSGNAYLLSAQETYRIAGWVRISVDEHLAPFTWQEYTKLSGVSAQTANRLRKIAYERGCRLSDWRISFDPIEAKDWIRVERWNDSQWVDAIVDGKLIPWQPDSR